MNSASKETRVLLVDSSTVLLDLMEEKLSTDTRIVVVGKSSNGIDAILKTRETKPDIIILSLDMPFINGVEAIEHIMASHPTPILATSGGHTKNLPDALAKGALETIEKSEIEHLSPTSLARKIRFLASVTVFSHPGKAKNLPLLRANKARLERIYLSEKIISIASSTGGPRAISEILQALPEDTPFPIVIAQHMPEGFTEGMVKWMSALSRLSVKMGEMGEALKKGTVYFSPSEKHMVINSEKHIVLEQRTSADLYHPSCNKLLTSVGHAYGANAIAVILTGMGNDGVTGMKSVKDLGGFTIAQDEVSSSLFGMPKEAIASGCIDRVVPLDKIAIELQKHFVKLP